jgi:hypothetical protein
MKYLLAYILFTGVLFLGNTTINKTRITIYRGWLRDLFVSSCVILFWELCKIATALP